MELSYWTSRWSKGKTGFHAPVVNPHLKNFWPDFPLEKNSCVLVPLCGKSLDMKWLMDQGFRVIGIEISEVACRDFFKTHDLSYKERSKGHFTILEAENITIWQGDFFKMDPNFLPEISAIYDRGALVALPPKKRQQYSKKIFTLTSVNSHIFLHTFEYPENEKNGPPFSVTGTEIQELYGKRYNIISLKTAEILSNNEKFQKWGLTKLIENIYHLSGK